MSNFVVNLNEPPKESAPKKAAAPMFSESQTAPKKPNVFLKVLKILGALVILFLLVGAVGGYFYWNSLKKTPQYSLALLVDAARRDDQKAIDELVDTDAVVDDFMPQITDKAVELYGRGLAPATIQKMAQVAAPLLPAVKQRARAEVPNLIREKTKAFENIPFWAIAVGAERYLEIINEVDKSFVKSKIQERPLEVVLKRQGERWQVIAVRDEVLARRIAEKIGQDLIVGAKNGGVRKAGEQLGVSNLEEVLKKADGIFK
ncbi:MAG: hypothetical protein LH614_08245 [Pyrinomonadaceae bacterium]|nr:hypothetical protein [Pyrinomonadaceae bacterium]